jgi:hypothetical protein
MANDGDVTGEFPATPVRRTPTGPLPAVWSRPRVTVDRSGLDDLEADVIFELLVAVMWSDGELASAEVERGRAAAEIMGVRPRRKGALGAIADGPRPFGEIDIDGLSGLARRLAYAAAEWLADAAPDPSARRHGFVRALQMRLGVDDHEAAALAELGLGLGREIDDPRRSFAQLLRDVLRPGTDVPQ